MSINKPSNYTLHFIKIYLAISLLLLFNEEYNDNELEAFILVPDNVKLSLTNLNNYFSNGDNYNLLPSSSVTSSS